MNLERRRLLAFPLAALPGACAMSGNRPAGAAVTAPAQTQVRPAAVGQQWIYEVRNLYNGLVVDEVTETVASTGDTIRIERRSRSTGALPDEIHATWGMIEQDPHWSFPVRFVHPIPAWPADFDLGHTVMVRGQYRTLSDPDSHYFWVGSMRSIDWETVQVPAGAFTALHYEDSIRFQSSDVTELESERQEFAWFCPQIGRWALRRNQGMFFVSGRGGDRYEDKQEWRLLAWR